jgi:cysteine dioxygenase
MQLDHFLSLLENTEGSLPLRALVALMKELEVDRETLGEAVRFDPEHYRRNLLHVGPYHAALVLCWAPGQKSPIHDHVGSACGVRVVEGTVTERRLTLDSGGGLREAGTSSLGKGGVCGSFDGDIHEVRNDAEDEALITLHVYTPPLSVYHLFDEETGRRTEKEDAETGQALRARGKAMSTAREASGRISHSPRHVGHRGGPP